MSDKRFYLFLSLTVLTFVCTLFAQTPSAPEAAGVDLSGERFRGLVVPSKQVILTAPWDGIVQEVQVDEGDVVEGGQTLAQMDDGVQQIAVEGARIQAESRSEIEKTALTLEESEFELKNYEDLLAADAAKPVEVRRARFQRDQAKVAHEAAREQHELAKANFRLEQERLDRHQLRAPFAGRVIRVQAEPGAMLTRSDPVMSLAALDVLEAYLYLPVEMFNKLEVGQEVTLEAGDPVGGRLPGMVKTVDPIIDAASGTFRCVVTIANPDLALPAGFTVRLILPQ